MKYLVDTHLAIWSVADSAKLSAKAVRLMGDAGAVFYFSAASVWEIAIKQAKRPEDIPIGAEEARDLFLEAGYLEMPVLSSHSILAGRLPPVHADPFDRMLVAQAKTEGAKLLTHDHVVQQYGDFVIRV